MREMFRNFSEKVAIASGSHMTFLLAVAMVAVWALTGRYFEYSDTWQLFINTTTTVITFLMVFVIQNTQNRTARIVELKLDELLRGVEGARTAFVSLDHMSDDDLEEVHAEFVRMSEKYSHLLADDLKNVRHEIDSRQRRR